MAVSDEEYKVKIRNLVSLEVWEALVLPVLEWERQQLVDQLSFQSVDEFKDIRYYQGSIGALSRLLQMKNILHTDNMNAQKAEAFKEKR